MSRVHPLAFHIAGCLFLTLLAVGQHPACAADALKRDQPLSLSALLGQLNVVEAKVEKLDPRDDLSGPDAKVAEATMRVTRVLCGTQAKVDDQFTALTADSSGAPGLSGNRTLQVPVPIPDKGTLGLWRVYVGKGGIQGNLDDRAPKAAIGTLRTAGVYLLPFLGREGRQTESAAAGAAKLADALHQLSDARDEAAQTKLLIADMRDSNPYLAVTACWLLSRATAMKDRAAIAEDLVADPRVVLPARLVLDLFLTEGSDWIPALDPAWAASPRRDRLLPTLPDAARETGDFEALSGWIPASAGDGSLSMAQCLNIFDHARKNPRLLPAFENRVFQLTRFIGARRTAADRDLAFNYFRDLLKSAENDPIRLAAAAGLADAGRGDLPLTEKQKNEVRALRAQAKDPEVISLLDEALQAGNEPSAPKP